jgi:hypothetical protein
MKDIFKKIVRKLDLREYAPEMETEIQVWVNPPRRLVVECDGIMEAFRAVRVELQKLAEEAKDPENESAVVARGEQLGKQLNELGEAQMAVLAQLWSQGDDPATHWTTEEINALIERGMDTDPVLWPWMTHRTMLMIKTYRAGQKKV